MRILRTGGAALLAATLAVAWTLPQAAFGAPTAEPVAGSSTSTVDYTASDAVIPNPDRGFDHTTETHYGADGSGYDPLDPAVLRGYRADGITQIVRTFYLEKFVDQATLDPAWLALVQNDFDAARTAGISIIVRFAYVQGGDYPYSPPYGDATLPIVLGHIQQLTPLLRRNADVIATLQAGFIGLWGEWYYTDHFVTEPADPGTVTDADWAERRQVVDALLEALPGDRTVQLRTMLMKQTIEGVPTGEAGALTPSQAHDGSDLARLGHHNDCFLASPDDFGTFLSDPITLDEQYLAADSRYVPVGGETCAVDPPRSEYPSAAAEMARYYYSYLNADYNTDVLDSWGSAGLADAAKRLGYRFVMTESRVTGSGIELDVRNDGWAAPYNPRPVDLVLTGDSGTYRVPFDSGSATPADARDWAAGTTTTVRADACGVPAGVYRAGLALPSASPSLAANPDYAIQTANTGTWNSGAGLNDLGQSVTVTGAGCAPSGAGDTPSPAPGTGGETPAPPVPVEATTTVTLPVVSG